MVCKPCEAQKRRRRRSRSITIRSRSPKKLKSRSPRRRRSRSKSPRRRRSRSKSPRRRRSRSRSPRRRMRMTDKEMKTAGKYTYRGGKYVVKNTKRSPIKRSSRTGKYTVTNPFSHSKHRKQKVPEMREYRFEIDGEPYYEIGPSTYY
jgi:hypothetical protein